MVLGQGRLTYSPSLDGLRAVACIAVATRHAGLPVPGGYLGVTIFFVLSGYLITTLLLEEVQGVDLRGFWRRRVWRIAPLLVTVSTIGLAVALVVGHHDTVIGGLGSFTLGLNWLVVQDPEAAGLLNGNWSVMVEEQFYLAWPLVIVATAGVRRPVLLASVIAGAVTVAAWRYHLASEGWERTWFGTDTQLDGLLVGAAVALGAVAHSRALAVAAAWVIGWALVTAEPGVDSARFVIPAVIVATAVLLPFLRDHPRLLGGPLPAIGRRSYGLYLWGGPIMYLAAHTLELEPVVAFVVGGAATAVVAEVTYRWVEVPLRRRGRSAAEHRGRQPGVAGAPVGVVGPVGRVPAVQLAVVDDHRAVSVNEHAGAIDAAGIPARHRLLHDRAAADLERVAGGVAGKVEGAL